MGVRSVKPPIRATTATSGRQGRQLCDKYTLLVGQELTIFQALLAFDISPPPLPQTIVNGNLVLYLYENLFPFREKTVAVHQIISPWKESRVNLKELIIEPVPVCRTLIKGNNQFIHFDITPLVQAWYNGSAANLGILLKPDDSSKKPFDIIGFCSRSCCNSRCWPSIEVTFADSAAAQITSAALEFDCKVTTSDTVQSAATLQVLQFTYTYFVSNSGSSPAFVALEISPDGSNWIPEGELSDIHPGKTILLISGSVAKYARITFRSAEPGQSTCLAISVRGYSV